MSPLDLLLGPMVVPECRRAGSRGWLVLVRTLAGLAACLVGLSFIWFWWLWLDVDPDFWPYELLRWGVATLEVMLLALMLIFSPAVLAGSLAGEKERGALGLLLTTRMSSREIVLGRLVGKLSQVAVLALAFVPMLVWFAALAGLRAPAFAMLLVLPAAVAFGVGGIAIAASSLSRRGRDALLVVYLLDVLMLCSPLVSAALPATPVADIVNVLSPFGCVLALAWEERVGPALGTVAIWSGFGLLGTVLAAWRLRPACLGADADSRRNAGRKVRRWRIPPVDERRPVLWKELYIERAGNLGRFGRWLGLFIVLALVIGSTFLALQSCWYLFIRFDDGQVSRLAYDMSQWIGGRTSFWVVCLIQWAIGLRAAVAISSERERGTWDALLTSPLQGGAIVLGKLWGNLYALRWLFAAALWAWTLALLFGGMDPQDYFTRLGQILCIGAFMAAVGVRTSLATPTATRAMAITIGVWLGSWVVTVFGALVIVCGVMLLCFAVFSVAYQAGLPWTAPWFPMSFDQGMTLSSLVLYLVATVLIVTETRLRFDRIAGRMAGGETQVSVDHLLHGRPMAPVRLGPDETKTEPHAEIEGEPARPGDVVHAP
jgi:ABC-type transport system involved in multi-copper enzyme maturation permease subunit